VIVKERELVIVTPGQHRVWVGDVRIVPGFLPDDEWFKVEHQLVCSECHRGVRVQDEHRCDEPD
jgi:hypothetical protein